MSYLISDIRSKNPEKDFRYLFDANIWLAVLEDYYFRNEYKPYITFFNKIINNTFSTNSKLSIPGLLLSEIINRILRDIYFIEFKKYNPEILEFKKYRKTEQYAKDINIITANIRSYHNSIEFVSDNLNQYSCKHLIKNNPTHLDINDFIYSKIALEQGLIIVTNDSDFQVEDIYIFTTQSSLLNLALPQK